MVLQYDDDIKRYDSELEALENKRLNAIGQSNKLQDELGIEEGDFLYGIFGALESLEDEERLQLETKYKDALEWAGPRFGGGVGRLNGFVFIVYSNDHGKHFHVLHKGRGVNARFSFPDIDLINYKNSRNVINSKEVEVIRKYFQDPLNFEKLKSEFKKRNPIDT